MAPNRRFKKSRKERRKSLQISKDDLKYIGINQKLGTVKTTTSRDYDSINLPKLKKKTIISGFIIS